ncbi:tyrosine-type recombinase/integrase [Chloroflexota bacterium]
MGVSPKTLRFYRQKLFQFIEEVDYLNTNKHTVGRYLKSIPPNSNGLATRHASFRAIKTFYRWLETEYGLRNLLNGMPAPIIGKPILPALTSDEVLYIIGLASNIRDNAIIALFTESGLRLSELTNIKARDIDWQNRIIRVLGKGRKEAYAPFGELSERYLKEWLAQYNPSSNIWGLNECGIASMLRRLK